MPPFKFPNRNHIKDPVVREALLQLEQFLANPSFGTVRLAEGVREYDATTQRNVDPPSVQFDAVTVLETPPDSITETEIADDSISTPKLQANSVIAEKLAAISLEVGKYIRSTSYDPGVEGWAIDADGDAEFNDVIVRGLYEATGDDGEILQLRADGAITGGPEVVLYTGHAIEDEPGALHTGRADFPGVEDTCYVILEGPATPTGDHAYLYMRAVDPVTGPDFNTITMVSDDISIRGDNTARMRNGVTDHGVFVGDNTWGLYDQTNDRAQTPRVHLTSGTDFMEIEAATVYIEGTTIVDVDGADITIQATDDMLLQGGDLLTLYASNIVQTSTGDISLGANDDIDLVGDNILLDGAMNVKLLVDGGTDSAWVEAGETGGAFYAQMVATNDSTGVVRTLSVNENLPYAYRSDITPNVFPLPSILGTSGAESGSPSLGSQWFMQCGRRDTTINASLDAAVTFPVAFGTVATVLITPAANIAYLHATNSVSTSGFNVRWPTLANGNAVAFSWMAIGTK